VYANVQGGKQCGILWTTGWFLLFYAESFKVGPLNLLLYYPRIIRLIIFAYLIEYLKLYFMNVTQS